MGHGTPCPVFPPSQWFPASPGSRDARASPIGAWVIATFLNLLPVAPCGIQGQVGGFRERRLA